MKCTIRRGSLNSTFRSVLISGHLSFLFRSRSSTMRRWVFVILEAGRIPHRKRAEYSRVLFSGFGVE
jgi:hypothetical protein